MGQCLAVPVSPRRGGTYVHGEWQPSGIVTVSEAAPSPSYGTASPQYPASRIGSSPYRTTTGSPLQSHGIRHSQQLWQSQQVRQSQQRGGHTPGREDAASSEQNSTPGSSRRPQPPIADLLGDFDVPDVDETPKSWTRGELIGEGAFGSVYSGLDNDTGRLMAVKQVRVPRAAAVRGKVAAHLNGLEADIAVLRRLQHPNIVRYLGSERQDDFIHIFLEFVPGGSIANLLTRFGAFCEPVVRVYTRDILTGLAYLHAHRIMHRDIKGANLLVASSGRIKLADFGASRKIEELASCDSNMAQSLRGTAYWMAPEVIKQAGHGRSADIWSVACTVIEMFTGKPPWTQHDNQVAALFHIASADHGPELPKGLSDDGRDFLRLCFNRNQKARPLAADLLHHPFLQPMASSIPRSPGGTLAAAAAAPVAQSAQAIAPLQLGTKLGASAGFLGGCMDAGVPVSPIMEESAEWKTLRVSDASSAMTPPLSHPVPPGSLVDSLRVSLQLAPQPPPPPHEQRSQRLGSPPMMDLHAEPEPSAPTPQPQPPPSTAAVAESERAKPPAEAAPGLDADAAPATPQQRKQGGPPARDGSETGPGNADDNPFEDEFNPMEEPDNAESADSPASPRASLFSETDAAGLSCLSPGPRLRASADAGRWRYDSGDFGKAAAPAGAKAGGGARATLDFEEAAAATVAPVVVQQSLKQGVEIQSWVAQASAANVAAASQPFLHDDHVAGPLAAVLDAAAPPKDAGAPADAAPQPQAGVAATAAAAASTPPLTVSMAVAASTAALSQSNEEDHGVVHDVGQEQSSPNVQPGTSSGSRKQWPSPSHSAASAPCGGSAKKDARASPSNPRTRPLSQSQALPRGGNRARLGLGVVSRSQSLPGGRRTAAAASAGLNPTKASYADMALARGVPASPAKHGPLSASKRTALPPRQQQGPSPIAHSLSALVLPAAPKTANRAGGGGGQPGPSEASCSSSQLGGGSQTCVGKQHGSSSLPVDDAPPALLQDSINGSDAGSWCSASSEQPLSLSSEQPLSPVQA